MRKLTLKPILTAILTVAIAITSVNTGYVTTTVNAATTMDTFTDGATVTMKTGDVKKLTVTNEEGKDYTDKYRWSSSDTNIVTTETDFIDEDKSHDLCLILTAHSVGTVTITGKFRYSNPAYKGSHLYEERPDVSMTVVVEQPKVKMTAKQKKCKHKYKTTRKATCERTGVKTCKKCKWQKEIKKTDHKWMEINETTIEYTEYYDVAYCIGCYCPGVKAGLIEHNEKNTICEHPCTAKWSSKDYGTVEAMEEAIWEHVLTSGCSCNPDRVQWGIEGGGPNKETTVQVTVCEHCGVKKDK